MRHWIKFNVVGVAGFALQSAVLLLLTQASYSINYLAATAVAVELAVLNNFAWHQKWTWKDRPSTSRKETISRLAKFNVTTGMVAIAGNVLLMSILVGRFDLPVVPANGLTVAICSLASFFVADRLVFD